MSFWNCFSQDSFEKMPGQTKEIHFTYESKSSFYFDQQGIYADTIIFKMQLPNVKFAKTKHPKDGYFCGFLSFLSMDKETQKKVMGILYHSNEKFKGVYDFKKNKSIIKAIRNDADVKKLFNEVFKTDYSAFAYTICLDYENKNKTLDFPLTKYDSVFAKEQKKINWIDNISGSFTDKKDNLLLTSTVESDKNLPKQITLGFVLENNNYGIKKVSTAYETYELTSITYE
jgi:hypothetical protein